ncbi:uncharacterized protein LOC136029496 isoform X2 [Artemia franciscana]|uniref:uncharacterized protein LOC136029496 isoform X2 n=1 Tax=Artemia franciscana TaxID=6661 RepID=UPI0032DB1715
MCLSVSKMTRKNKKTSETTLPAPRLRLPGLKMTLPTPGQTLPATEPALSTNELTLPGPSLLATKSSRAPPANKDSMAVSRKKKKKSRAFWKMCPFCHRSFEYLEKHLLAKKGACGKKPNGESWTAAEVKEMHEKAKDELEEKTRDKSYFSASQVKAALIESKTLHKFCRALTEMTGLYFDTMNVRDCSLSIHDIEPATRTVSNRPTIPDAPPSAPAREEPCECCDYCVKPNDFNKRHDMSLILSERARKRRRDVLMANAKEEMPKEISGASSGISELSAAQKKTKKRKKKKKKKTIY